LKIQICNIIAAVDEKPSVADLYNNIGEENDMDLYYLEHSGLSREEVAGAPNNSGETHHTISRAFPSPERK
jgi:hypothetical protein